MHAIYELRPNVTYIEFNTIQRFLYSSTAMAKPTLIAKANKFISIYLQNVQVSLCSRYLLISICVYIIFS